MNKGLAHLLVATICATGLPVFAQSGSAKPSCAPGDAVVWENTNTKAYLLPGDKYYGKHEARRIRVQVSSGQRRLSPRRQQRRVEVDRLDAISDDFFSRTDGERDTFRSTPSRQAPPKIGGNGLPDPVAHGDLKGASRHETSPADCVAHASYLSRSYGP
jgi:hypothetical protein